MEKVEKKASIAHMVSLVLETVTIICFIVVLCMVLLQIISRIFHVATTSWTDEVLQFFMMYLVFIGSAFLVERNAHVQVNMLPAMFKGITRKIWDVVIHVLIIAASIGILYGGLFWVRDTIRFTPYLQIPYKYYHVVVPISAVLFVFFSVCHLVEIIQRSKNFWRDRKEDVSDLGKM